MAQEPHRTHLNRDFNRYPLNLSATLIRQRHTHHCRIKDYCLGGLLVIFDPTDEQRQPPVITAGENLVIGFRLSTNRTCRWMKQAIRVVRLVRGGCGVMFVDPSPDFTRALEDHIVNSNQATGRDAETGADERSVNRHEQVLALCKDLTHRYLPDVYDEIYRRSNDELLLHARERARNSLEQNAIFDDILKLEQNWRRNQDLFIRHIHHKLHRVILPQGGSPPNKGQFGHSRLRLVEQNEFEDWLSIAEMSDRVQSHYSEILFTLARQYSVLTRSRDRILNFPLGPDTLGHALQESVATLGLRSDVTRIIFEQAGTVLIDALTPLYRELADSFALL